MLDAKLQPPPTRPDWIERARLLKELDQAIVRPVVLVPAPAGFGKTTMLVQWLTSNRGAPRFGWVDLDPRDNDSVLLWTHIALALERAGCRFEGGAISVIAAAGHDMIGDVVTPLLRAMTEVNDEIILVLDDFHELQDPACHRQMEFFVAHLPAQAHLVILTRADPGLRLGRLRATGHLAQIRSAALAFTVDEAAAMISAEGVQLTDDAVSELVDRTEGWPAGLYLAALTMSGRPDPEAFVREISGSSKFIGDYLTEEVLAAQSEKMRTFIRATSILDRFSASLCNVLVETTDSAAILSELERTNLFLIPLDDERRWYRFHHVLASVARSELELEAPESIPGLHSRAATWFRENEHVAESVSHSLASGDTSDAVLLLQENWLEYVDSGRAPTVLRWLEALGPEVIEADPGARVTAAWLAALTGDTTTLHDHLAALAPFAERGPLADGAQSVESASAMIQGVFGYGGPQEMTTAAHRAIELELDPRSPFYSVARLAGAHAAYVAGDYEQTLKLATAAAWNDAAPNIVQVLTLSLISLTHGEYGDEPASFQHAEQAMAIVEARGLRGAVLATIAFTAVARAQAAAGDLPAALASIDDGLILCRRDRDHGPWVGLHHFLTAARVSAEAGHLDQAREFVEEASLRMDRFSGSMVSMRGRLELIRQSVAPSKDAPGVDALTARETDVLRLLQSTLSLNEIAGQLYISGNTVKTHTKAVYRKLGVNSRAELRKVARGRLLV